MRMTNEDNAPLTGTSGVSDVRQTDPGTGAAGGTDFSTEMAGEASRESVGTGLRHGDEAAIEDDPSQTMREPGSVLDVNDPGAGLPGPTFEIDETNSTLPASLGHDVQIAADSSLTEAIDPQSDVEIVG